MPASVWSAALLDANRVAANDSLSGPAAIRFARIVVLELDLKPGLFDERDRVGDLDRQSPVTGGNRYAGKAPASIHFRTVGS
jgi:hypothetical protein